LAGDSTITSARAITAVGNRQERVFVKALGKRTSWSVGEKPLYVAWHDRRSIPFGME
jgi:hypothetical protein